MMVHRDSVVYVLGLIECFVVVLFLQIYNIIIIRRWYATPFLFFSEGTVQPRGRILLPASPCYETNIKSSGGPCQRYNGGQNEELAHIFFIHYL